MRRISTPKGITELNKILENHHCQIAHPKMNEKELRTTLGYVSHSLNNLAKQTPEKIESLAQLIRNKFGGYIHTQMSVDKIFENLKNLNDRERAKIFERMIQMFVKR